MLKIRLRRMGATNQAFFRVVVSDSRKATTSSAVEEIGIYDPRSNPPRIQIDRERVDYWVKNGALLSDTVRQLVAAPRADMTVGEDLLQVVRLLVDDPRAARIEERELPDGTLELQVHLPENERGKLIGRHGRTIEALRALATAREGRDHRRYAVELVED